MKDLQFTLINMRPLTKIDVILHKVRINTRCFIYWSKSRAEEVAKQLQSKTTFKYRNKWIVK